MTQEEKLAKANRDAEAEANRIWNDMSQDEREAAECELRREDNQR